MEGTDVAERSGRAQSRALRVTIAYDGRTLRVVDRITVEMATAPSDPVRGYEGQSGFWYELRDAKGAILYRRIVANPIQFDLEVHDPETGSRREPVAKPRGVFVVLVPDLPSADSLVLMSSPLEPEKSAAAAEALVRFPLRPRRRAR